MVNMNKNSRTTNTIFNFTSSIGGQLITILMHFVVRTVFINTLGKSYLGISGLFSNILSMLALAEFGVGSAIIFKLYKPIADEDHQRIAILMKFYKVVYRVVGSAIGIIGLILIPFLPIIISDYDRLEQLGINAVFILILYLLKSVVSYLFFAYKSAIIKANQKEYLITVIGYFFTVGSTLLQIVSLLIYPSFTIYVTIMVIQVIVQNVVYAKLADKMYPYINERTEEKLSRTEIKETLKDCAALFLYELNDVVLKATDNIVLSMFVGLNIVAEYSNYYILYNTINSLFNKIFNSMSHSLGNLNASEGKEKGYPVLESTILITAIIGATAGIGIFVVADELIETWIGNDWVIEQPFSLLMGFEIFTMAFRLCVSKFRTTLGLFQQAKFRPIAGMIINLVVSVILVQSLGIVGVLIGTVTSDWTTTMWIDPLVIHKYGYNNEYRVSVYFFKLFKYLAIACVMGAVNYLVCTHFLTGYGWFSVIVHAVICGITVPAAYVLLNIHSKEGKYVYKLTVTTWNNFMKKVKKVR